MVNAAGVPPVMLAGGTRPVTVGVLLSIATVRDGIVVVLPARSTSVPLNV